MAHKLEEDRMEKDQVQQDQIQKRLTRAIEEMTPDIYEQLMEQTKEQPEKDLGVDSSKQQEEWNYILSDKRRMQRTRYRKMTYMAATLAAVLCLTLGLGWYQFLAADSIVGLDVNPSLEFTINRRGRVVSVQAYNRDAKIVMEGMDLEQVDLNTAVNAVLGSMLRHNYLEEGQDTVLLTVQNSDDKKAADIREELLDDINDILEESGTDGRIVSQIVEESEELEVMSQSHHMSCGKAKLIQNILTQDDSLSAEELSRMSVQELMELAGQEDMDLHEHMEYDKQDFCGQNHSSSGRDSGDGQTGGDSEKNQVQEEALEKAQGKGHHGSDSEHHRQEKENY